MYEHTQRGPWHLLLLAVAVGMLAGAYFAYQEKSPAAIGLAFGGIVLFIASFAFERLVIRDEGDTLSVRFGPLPLIGVRIRYADIQSFKRGRSTFVDGWGLHWVPGRGVTINIWGFDCVELQVKSRGTIRIGTDDPEGLLRLLELKMPLFSATRATNEETSSSVKPHH